MKVLDDMIAKSAKEAAVKDTQGDDAKKKKAAAKADPNNPNP